MALFDTTSASPLLSILIPTFNRAEYLEKLLHELVDQLSDIQEGLVEIIIADNCSTDETPHICHQIAKTSLHIQVYSHKKNIGPDKNFLFLLEKSSGKFFWLFGDDDLPRRGLISLLKGFLSSKSPTLVYLPSKWSASISTSDLTPITEISFLRTDPVTYSRQHHIWTTFISAWIINRESLLGHGLTVKTLENGIGSYFIQLGWILPLLLSNEAHFYTILEDCVLATSANQRGDHFLSTFCIRYPDSVRRLVGSNRLICRSLISPFTRTYLPSLILSVRLSRLGSPVRVWPLLFPTTLRLWSYPSFWLFCLPLLIIPTFLISYIKEVYSYLQKVRL